MHGEGYGCWEQSVRWEELKRGDKKEKKKKKTHHDRTAPEGPAPRAAGEHRAALAVGREGAQSLGARAGVGGSHRVGVPCAQGDPDAEAVGPELETWRRDGEFREGVGGGPAVVVHGRHPYRFATAATVAEASVRSVSLQL